MLEARISTMFIRSRVSSFSEAPRTVIVPHPLGGLRESEVMEYVAAAVDEVIRIVENGA